MRCEGWVTLSGSFYTREKKHLLSHDMLPAGDNLASIEDDYKASWEMGKCIIFS